MFNSIYDGFESAEAGDDADAWSRIAGTINKTVKYVSRHYIQTGNEASEDLSK